MNQDSGLTRIIRGLTWTGTIFLVLTAVAIVWAVFRTRGIDDLITALTVTGLGFGLPAVVAFVVAWLLGTFDDAEADGRAERIPLTGDTQATFPVLSYFVAIAAVGVAWALRAWLDPILGREVPYITFFLAVALAAWAGGIGPALLAAFLSLMIAWYFYVVTKPFPSERAGREFWLLVLPVLFFFYLRNGSLQIVNRCICYRNFFLRVKLVALYSLVISS